MPPQERKIVKIYLFQIFFLQDILKLDLIKTSRRFYPISHTFLNVTLGKLCLIPILNS